MKTFIDTKLNQTKPQQEPVKFSIISHSQGSVVAYKAMALDNFPIEHLSNVFNLGAPLQEPPHQFNSKIGETLKKTQKSWPASKFAENVAHYNFHGGHHDLLVSEEATKLEGLKENSKCEGCFLHLSTVHMKNMFSSVSHNWLYFDWLLLN